MAKQKYWDGTKWVQVAPSMEEFTTHLADYTQHTGNKNNPHGVTKAQVDLGSVQNYGLATEAEAKTGTSNTKYMTPLRTAQAIEELASSSSSQTFIANGTFTVPKGVNGIFLTACGGGGGGNAGNNGRGGGGGACIIKTLYTVTPGSKLSITVGVGGNRGVAGTATIIGNLVTLSGGGAGTSSSPGLAGGPGGGAGGSSGGSTGGAGIGGYGGQGYDYGSGGGGSYGGGGGAGHATYPGKGGSPIYSSASNGGYGGDGTSSGGVGGLGAGGGSGGNNGFGGAGGNGIVIIEW